MRRAGFLALSAALILALAAVAWLSAPSAAKDEVWGKKVTVIVHEGGTVKLIAGEENTRKKEAKEGAVTVFEFADDQRPAFQIVPDEASEVDKVKIDGDVSEGLLVVKLPEGRGEHRIEVFFQSRYVVVTAICREGGALDVDGVKVSEGEKKLKFLEDELTINALPERGYRLDALLVDGAPVKYRDDYLLKLKDGVKQVEIKAHFVLKEHDIVIECGQGGSVSPSGKVQVKHGSKLQVDMKANEGFQIDSVTVRSLETGNEKELGKSVLEDLNKGRELIFVVTQPASIKVKFDRRMYRIRVKDCSHGKITPKGVREVRHGEESPKFEVEPESGWEVDEFCDNGREVKLDSGKYYQIRKVTEEHELSVTFKKKK